jgi:hypothetical protein
MYHSSVSPTKVSKLLSVNGTTTPARDDVVDNSADAVHDNNSTQRATTRDMRVSALVDEGAGNMCGKGTV